MIEDTVPPWMATTGFAEGDAASVRARIGTVQLTGGQTLSLPASGVTAVVGANNTGKSTLLRQVNWLLFGQGAGVRNEPAELVTGVTVECEGTAADFLAWLGEHATYRAMPDSAGQFFRPGQGSIDAQYAANAWNKAAFAQLASYLVRYADAQSRFGGVAGVGQRGDVADPPQHPLHALQDDARLRVRLDEIAQQIFRAHLTLDDVSGNMRLRVGQPAVPAPSVSESQAEYRAALAKLPPLETQGDGMKSLLGLLLPLVTATYPIVIVDEPEAFLHPPQAYALGLALGRLAQDSHVQVLLATHDRSLLAGLLASESPLSVVRLERRGDEWGASQLEAEKLSDLWTDSVLRYSNVLDGLFHQCVVVAEAEPDCRFYAAAIDAADKKQALSIPPSDILFVPSNGKAGMARLAQALRSVSVRVLVTPDLDVLNDEATIANLVTSLGHDWTPLKKDYDIATAKFRLPREHVQIADVRTNILAILEAEDQADTFTHELREKVRTAMRLGVSPWQALKEYGDRAFRNEAAMAFERLSASLDKIGVILVQVGELEGFAPALGVSKGKAWLPAALRAEAHQDPAAQAHVLRLVTASSPPV